MYKKNKGAMLEFILFSRCNCTLCEAMEDELRPYIKKYSMTVKRLYIDNDAELERRYGSKVPVLTLAGKTLCEYFLDAETLLTVLSEQQLDEKR
jgi:hypothetical protein